MSTRTRAGASEPTLPRISIASGRTALPRSKMSHLSCLSEHQSGYKSECSHSTIAGRRLEKTRGAEGARGWGRGGVSGHARSGAGGCSARHGLHPLPTRHEPVCVGVAIDRQPCAVSGHIVRGVNDRGSQIEQLLLLLPGLGRQRDAAAGHCNQLHEEQDSSTHKRCDFCE